jgi:[acyl-carrier-protein] S-malonyltransferase
MAKVFVFPGQGTQKVGMAAPFFNAFASGKETMLEIEDAISFELSKLIDEGPAEKLTRTEYAQLAIFAVGMMCVSIMKKEFGYDITKESKYLAGHSLGEYTALCTAGVFSIADCARLVKMRGEAMARCVPDCDDCVMSVMIGAGVEKIEDIIREQGTGGGACVIAADNSPSQVVVSGYRGAVQKVGDEAKRSAGVVKIIELSTSGPFHNPIMAKAAIELDEAMSKYCVETSDGDDNSEMIVLNDFRVPVIMNSDSLPQVNKSEVCALLIKQMTSRVRWRETIEFVLQDREVDEIVEVAPGRVLSTLVKKSYPNFRTSSLETIAQIEEFTLGDRAA